MPKSISYSKKRSNQSIDWLLAPDIKKRVNQLITNLEEKGFNQSRVFCYRSYFAKTKAIARIWGFPRVWQIALKQKPAYIIEVISEKFDRLNSHEKDKVLLHEITHIPKNFSGALIPHIRRGKRSFNDKLKKLMAKSFPF